MPFSEIQLICTCLGFSHISISNFSNQHSQVFSIVEACFESGRRSIDFSSSKSWEKYSYQMCGRRSESSSDWLIARIRGRLEREESPFDSQGSKLSHASWGWINSEGGMKSGFALALSILIRSQIRRRPALTTGLTFSPTMNTTYTSPFVIWIMLRLWICSFVKGIWSPLLKRRENHLWGVPKSISTRSLARRGFPCANYIICFSLSSQIRSIRAPRSTPNLSSQIERQRT